MEEDIKILEKFKKYGYHTLMMEYGSRNKTNLKLETAIEHLIKAYKELENKLSEYKTINDIAEEIKRTVTEEDLKEAIKEINDDYIPVSLVEEKIEELKEKGESDLRTYGFAVETHLAKQVLQELLEKRK